MSSLVPVEISEDKQHILNKQFCATARIAYNTWSTMRRKLDYLSGFYALSKKKDVHKNSKLITVLNCSTSNIFKKKFGEGWQARTKDKYIIKEQLVVTHVSLTPPFWLPSVMDPVSLQHTFVDSKRRAVLRAVTIGFCSANVPAFAGFGAQIYFDWRITKKNIRPPY